MNRRLRGSLAGAIAVLLSFVAVATRAETAHGTWNIYPEQHSLLLATRWRSDDGSSSEDRDTPVDARALGIESALASSGERSSFAIQREAGDFAFDGWFGNGEAAGSYTFAANEAFFDALRKRGCDVRNVEQKMSVASVDLTLEYVDAIAASGYSHLTMREYIAFKAHGIDGAYLRNLAAHGFKNLPARQVIRFKAMGIE